MLTQLASQQTQRLELFDVTPAGAQLTQDASIQAGIDHVITQTYLLTQTPFFD